MYPFTMATNCHSSFAEVGAREQFAAITDFTVTMGLPGVNQRQETGLCVGQWPCTAGK